MRACLIGLFSLLWIANPSLPAVPDKSGVKASAISLPSGAGSIEGLGESFEPQLNTGSSSYGVGISLPPGRAGLQPKLRLVYNSGLGNSMVGLGWNLEIPSIKRQTDKGFPAYTANDVFLFQSEELVPLSNPQRDWRCENESQFQRFRQIDTDGDFAPDAWEMTERNGTRHIFGQYRGGGNRWSVVTHPTPPATAQSAFDRTYCWALNTTIDLHGNRIEYDYLPPSGVQSSSGILYPSRIQYSFLGNSLHEVRFRYEDRADVFDDYRPTFSIKIGKRLVGIDVYSFYDGAFRLVRAYDLDYAYRLDDGITKPPGALDLGLSTLKRISQRDRSANTNNYLPPLVFEYSQLQLDNAAVKVIDSVPAIDIANADGSAQIADVDGDGLPDLFQTTIFDQRFCLNRGETGKGANRQLRFSELLITNSPTPLQLNIPDSGLTDFDGDGLVDYIQLSPNNGYNRIQMFPNASRLDRAEPRPPGFSQTPTNFFDAPPAISLTDTSIRQMDLNFDKISDFVSMTPGFIGRFDYYLRDASGAWQTLANVPFNADMPGNLSFSEGGSNNPAIHLADMNGDRLQDLVSLEKSGSGVGARLTVRYWPYCGLGRWATVRVMTLSSNDVLQVDALDLRDVLVQDLTGDGLADIAILRSGGGATSTLDLRVNIAGSRWSAPFTKPSLPRYQPFDGASPTVFRQADLNGNGSTDLIWRNQVVGDNSLKWLDLLADGKPNLLVRIDNSLGKRTEITYGSSTEDLVRAREAGFPWQTKCPFPVQVVRRIRTTCGLDLDGSPDPFPQTTDHYVSEFRYRDAFYDAFEREFRGFAFAERVDYGDDFLLDSNLVTMARSSGWDAGKTPTGQVSGPTTVTRFRYLTGASDGRDNDEYPVNWSGPRLTDEVSPKGGREEEILKGRQVWEEKVDPWVLHELSGAGNFDRGAFLALTSTNAIDRSRMTPDDFVYSRARQEWAVRRLYRPNDVSWSPSGRFADASPPIYVINGLGGSGRSVSFSFVSAATNEIIEANGLLKTALGYATRNPSVTAQSSDYDDYGNETVQRDFGVVNDSSFDDERFTLTDFALDGEAINRWIIGKPSRIRVTDESGVFVSETRNYYDGTPFFGQPLHAMGARALLHRVEQVVTGSSPVPAITAQSDRPGDPRLAAGKVIQKVRNSYDAYGNLLATIDPLGNPADLSAGHARQIAYDSTFETYPVSETILIGQGKPSLAMSAGYDFGFGVITSSKDFNGNPTSFEYDSFARLVAIVKPGDSTQFPTALFEYLPADPTRFRVYRYNRAGSLTVETSGGVRSASRVVSRLREQSGQAGTHVMVSYTDGCGRKLAEVKESDLAGRWVVNAVSAYNRRMSASSRWLPYEIASGSDDSTPPQFGELWPASRPPLTDLSGRATVKTDLRYDSLGREIITINPPETLATITNEAARTRATTQILPLEKRIYDEEDNKSGGPFAGTPMVQFTDGLGRLIKVQELARLNDDGTPSGNIQTWPTVYAYDLNDKLVHILDSQNNEKWFRYDGLGRKIFMNDPDRGVMFYTYDDASNLAETTDAKGQLIAYTYDGVNRLLTEDYLDDASAEFSYRRSPDVTYHYDAPAGSLDIGDGTLATATNTRGFLSYVEDTSGEEHNSYDARGRVTYVIKRIPDPLDRSVLAAPPLYLVNYRTKFDYDALDRTTRITYPDNDEASYEYSPRNLLRRIVGGPSGSIISNITYKASEQLDQIDYGNGIRTRYDYDPRLRLNSLITAPAAAPASPLIAFGYTFDGVSNIKLIEDQRPGSVVPQGDERRNTQVFSYDDLYRLTQARYSFELPGQAQRNDGEINYRYDRIGNMLAQTSTLVHEEKGLPVANLGEMDSGGSAGRVGRVGRNAGDQPGPHALTRVRNPQTANRDYRYDANGNMTVIDGLTNTWDFKDRLVAVENAEMRAEYTYDYTDRRITKRVSWKPGYPLPSDGRGAGGEGVTTTLYIDRIFEVRDHDAPTKYVWNGSTRVARVTGNLSATPRIQRIRIRPGWNLLSLAVGGASVPVGTSRVNLAARWNQVGQNWLAISPNDSLAAGTVLWLNATTNAVLAFTGTYVEPTNRPLAIGANFQTSASLEPLDLRSALSPLSTVWWRFDSATSDWLNWLPTDFQSPSYSHDILPPGEAFFAKAQSSGQMNQPEMALKIYYYHQDHLGSSSVMSDVSGALVEEAANYAFGHARHESRFRGQGVKYRFTQKETDSETDFAYFESRYLLSVYGRFTSIDPQCQVVDGKRITEPQRLNFASYCANRPVTFVDPTGCIESSYDSKAKTLTIDLKLNTTFQNDTAKWTKNEMAAWKADASKAIEGYFNSLSMKCGDGEPLQIKMNVTYVSKGADFDVTVSHDPQNRSHVMRSLFEKSAKFDIQDPYPQNKGAKDPQVPIVHEVGHMLRLDHPGGRSNSKSAYTADLDSVMGGGKEMRQKDFDRAFCERRGAVEGFITRMKDKLGL